MSPPLVLFLGTNAGAFSAAANLGLRFAVVAPSPPWACDAWSWFQADLEAPPDQVMHAAHAACRGERPDAVLGFMDLIHVAYGFDPWEAVRAMPGVILAECHLGPGTVVEPRIRAGQDAGRIVVAGSGRNEVARRLVAAREALEIHIERP